MGKPTNKTYVLKLMTDMYEIPEDRFDDFIVQLKKWHSETRGLSDALKAISSAVGEEMPTEYGTLKWTDDGIEDGHTKVRIKQSPLTNKRKSK